MVILLSLVFVVTFTKIGCILGASEYEDPIPYALSPAYLQFLSKQERSIYQTLKEYEHVLEERLKLLKKYTKDYEDVSISGLEYLGDKASNEKKDEETASNPILTYRMLSRYTNEFVAINENMNNGLEEISKLMEKRGIQMFPSDADTEDVHLSLLRTQFIYNLKSHDIAGGNIPGISGNATNLTTEQCYKIAKCAQRNNQYFIALQWFDTVKLRLQDASNSNEDSAAFLSLSLLNNDVEDTILEHNKNYQEITDVGGEYSFTQKILSRDDPRITLRSQVLEKFAGLSLSEKSPSDYYNIVYANNIALCNGHNFQSLEMKAKLYCWLDHERNAFWRLGPLKMEMINQDPLVLQIHDFISSKWMTDLQKSSYATMERQPVGGPNAILRTAAYKWFKDSEIPQIPLSKRIGYFTGLNVVGEKAAEALQVAAYASGAHVELHLDSKPPNDPDPKGERITTFLIYLNDVEFGGLTSFAKLGFAVKPIKGSALMWYTNKKHGTADLDALHAACPLISGQKWIATKWINSHENMFTRPCGITFSN